ncbi:hypothetical protein [Nocardia gamkensis]|uniref:hypothetical protein n=1 Tax=Nocardia gamkensis TaxID=352869 RepID=UPI0037C9B4C8
MDLEPYPQWLRPPPGGFVAEDLDRLPDLPPHTELIDGSLVFGIHHDRLKLTVPFDMDIDLTEIDRL